MLNTDLSPFLQQLESVSMFDQESHKKYLQCLELVSSSGHWTVTCDQSDPDMISQSQKKITVT